MADEVRARPEREQRFEKRMSDAEALMWNVEKDPWLNPSGASLIILDRPPDFDHFRQQVAAAVVEVPRLMERVVGGLGRLQPPVWRPDPEFDLDFHVRKVALPAPGTMRQLQDMVAQIYQDPYDRTRPLWMYFVIEGLEDGGAAMVWKIHHTVADGTGAARLSEAFIQPTRDAPEPPEVDLDAALAALIAADDEAGDNPSVVDSLVGTATHFARRQAGITRRLAGEMAMLGRRPAARPRRGQRRRRGDQPAAQRAARRRRAATARGSCTTASRSCRAARRCGATARVTVTSR